MVCAACLKTILGKRSTERRRLRRIAGGIFPVAGLLLAWLFFYGIGRLLMLIPASVHDGTAWTK